VRVSSTAGTVFLPKNITRSCFKKLPSAGQGPHGAKLTSGGKPSEAAGQEVIERSKATKQSKAVKRSEGARRLIDVAGSKWCREK